MRSSVVFIGFGALVLVIFSVGLIFATIVCLVCFNHKQSLTKSQFQLPWKILAYLLISSRGVPTLLFNSLPSLYLKSNHTKKNLEKIYSLLFCME